MEAVSEELRPHKIEYDFHIRIDADKLAIHFTGERVNFEPDSNETPIRPRHIRLVSEIQGYMKQKMLDFK